MLFVDRHAFGETPCALPRGQSNSLGVDVCIGSSLADCLKTGDWFAELISRRGVRRDE